MASTCYLRDIVCTTGRCFKWLLMLTLITVSECRQLVHLQGEVGGEVAFHCPVALHKKVHLLYLQKSDTFVNGYYVSEKIEKYWPNTRVDQDKNVIYMSGLNISHAAVYTCLIQYSDYSDEEVDMELIVTANYSKPSVDNRCTDKQDHCLVSCSSHGGYPKNQILWNVTGTEAPTNARMWKIVNSTDKCDKDSLLFNVSSVAFFNCSSVKHQNVSCSVDGVTTVFTICEQGSSPETYQPASVIVALCVCVGLLVGVIILVLWCKYKRKNRSKCGTNNVL